jgi:hypothetical protein
MLRPQDLLVLVQVAANDRPAGEWTQQDLANATGLSQAEVHNAFKRTCRSNLWIPAANQKVARAGLLEFLVHGVKYVFPAQLGGPTRGVPTAWAAPPLSEHIMGGGDLELPVWPHPDGKARGSTVEPLYKTIPDVALNDSRVYEVFALVDALRFGRARERKLAEKLLRERLQA